VIELEDAVSRILSALPRPQTEEVDLASAAGRILGASITAKIDLPPFDNSAMDGYAVRAADVTGASPRKPARLRLCTRIAAGEVFEGELGSGECARLFTGAAMPKGADAVVMQEDTQAEGSEVLVFDSVRVGESVRHRGEDMRQGDVLAKPGTEISPALVGLCGALGSAKLPVNRPPRIGLIATGSELREPGQSLTGGQIYESNRAMLATLVTRAGGKPHTYPIVADVLMATRTALEQAFAANDIVITSGGVSVGEMDFVKEAFETLGGNMEFWKVAIRPGKPFVFGQFKEKLLFGLPGNPVSAFVTFLLLVWPALRRWQGAIDLNLPSLSAELGEAFVNRGDRRHFMRVQLSKDGRVISAGKQASHALGSLACSEGLLDVPPLSTLSAGTLVKVLTGF